MLRLRTAGFECLIRVFLYLIFDGLILMKHVKHSLGLYTKFTYKTRVKNCPEKGSNYEFLNWLVILRSLFCSLCFVSKPFDHEKRNVKAPVSQAMFQQKIK